MQSKEREAKENSTRISNNFFAYFKPHWNIISNGFPLALSFFLGNLPLISMSTFAAHETLQDINVIALFVATYFTLIENTTFSCGFAYQGLVAKAIGARDSVLVQRQFQRAMISGAIIYICITIPTVISSYWVLPLFHQPQYIALKTTICLAIVAPASLFWVFIMLINRTLIAQKKIWIVVGFGLYFTIVGVVSQFISYWFNCGAIGLATAYSITCILMAMFVMIVTLVNRSQRELITDWSRESFSELWAMGWLIIKTAAYNFTMRLFIEVGTVLIGMLGQNQLAAQSILLRYELFVVLIAQGFWTAAVALMGRAAGAQKREKFLNAFRATITVYVILALIAFILMFALRYPLMYWSTSITSIQVILENLTQIVGFLSASILLWYGSTSMMFALGLVNVPTIITLVSEFLIGMPIAFVLSFYTSLQLFGFYIGLIVSYLLKLVLIWTYYACFMKEVLSNIQEQSPGTLSESSPFVMSADKMKPENQSSEPENPSAGNTYGTNDGSANAMVSNDGSFNNR